MTIPSSYMYRIKIMYLLQDDYLNNELKKLYHSCCMYFNHNSGITCFSWGSALEGECFGKAKRDKKAGDILFIIISGLCMNRT